MVAATEAATEAAATQGAQATEVAMLLRGVAVQVRSCEKQLAYFLVGRGLEQKLL